MIITGSQLLEKQRRYFHSGATRSTDFRIKQLKKLRQAIVEREPAIIQALRDDLNKSELEAYTFEIGLVYSEISFMIKHLSHWAKPKKVKTAFTHFGSRGYIVSEPLGSALIIAPWNYPFNLAFAPLVGAIAAGNTAVLKPSELAPSISAVMASLLRDTFDSSYIAVVEGGVEASRELTGLPFDKIFYTGSVAVGKLVMEAASKHLVPVTLELGGKCPCIVHDDASIELAGKRIAFGKYVNAGQTCLAPDYMLVHRSVKDKLVMSIKNAIISIYGEEPLLNPDYVKIVSQRHYDRLCGFLHDGSAVIGGRSDEETLRIEPTVLDQVTWDMPIMQEEIFGPILPIFTYENINEVIEIVTSRPKPLALYFFSENKSLQDVVTQNISFGGGCMNDTLLHMGTPYLPFGGVGESGMGQYHGESSFHTFSHSKSVLKQTTKFDFPFRYPSYKHALKIIRKLLKP